MIYILRLGEEKIKYNTNVSNLYSTGSKVSFCIGGTSTHKQICILYVKLVGKAGRVLGNSLNEARIHFWTGWVYRYYIYAIRIIKYVYISMVIPKFFQIFTKIKKKPVF